MSKTGAAAQFSGEAVERLRADADAAIAASAGEEIGLPIDLTDSEDHHALPDAAEITALQMELSCDVGAAVAEHRRRKGMGGRKRGAKNKRTDDFVRYALQFGPHPGITLMRVQGRPTEVLARELGCTKAEAMQMQIRAASELLPFFESKKPVDVNVTAEGQVSWVFNDAQAAVDGGLIEGESAAPMMRLDGEETAEKRGFEPDAEGVSE